MPQLKLTALLGLNKTGFDAGIRAADQAVERFSHKLTHKVAHAALAAFGIHSLMEFGKEVIRQAVEIDRLANRFNLTSTQVQLLQQESKRTGMEFGELVKDAEELERTLERISGGEVIFSERQIEQLNNVNEVIQEFKNQAGIRIAGLFGLGENELTPEQVAFLEKDAARKRKAATDAKDEKAMLELEKEIAELQEKNLPKEERLAALQARRTKAFEELAQMPNVRAPENLKKTLEIEKLNAEIASLSGGGGSEHGIARSGRFIPPSNSLGPIGAFTGGPNQALHAIGESTLILKRIESALVNKGIIIRDVSR